MPLTADQLERLMQLLIMFGVKKEEVIQIAIAMETQEMLLEYLDRISERNYDMTPEELYDLAGRILAESQAAQSI